MESWFGLSMFSLWLSEFIHASTNTLAASRFESTPADIGIFRKKVPVGEVPTTFSAQAPEYLCFIISPEGHLCLMYSRSSMLSACRLAGSCSLSFHSSASRPLDALFSCVYSRISCSTLPSSIRVDPSAVPSVPSGTVSPVPAVGEDPSPTSAAPSKSSGAAPD